MQNMLRTHKQRDTRRASKQRREARHQEKQSWKAEARWDAAHWRREVTR